MLVLINRFTRKHFNRVALSRRKEKKMSRSTIETVLETVAKERSDTVSLFFTTF
jgi:hypothetical protein